MGCQGKWVVQGHKLEAGLSRPENPNVTAQWVHALSGRAGQYIKADGPPTQEDRSATARRG